MESISKIRVIGLLVVLLLITGCYAEITGTVVDAETGKPIEGAVILVEWTITRGVPGMTHTDSYKVIEAVTDDKDGRVRIAGDIINPTVHRPHITVYKKGYVAWNNEYIFPDYKKRTDFEWRNGYVFKLERFKPEYTYTAHTDFLSGAIRTGAIERKSLILKAVEWEEKKAFEERQKRTQ